jgi:hypothetical protein
MKVIEIIGIISDITRDEIVSCGIDPDKPYLELTIDELLTLQQYTGTPFSKLIDIKAIISAIIDSWLEAEPPEDYFPTH